MKEFNHYYKRVPFEYVDVYRVLELFDVKDPAIQHAVKKLLVAGGRGHKDMDKDVKEAISSLNRWVEMRSEDISSSKYKIGPVGSLMSDYIVPAGANGPCER